MNLYRLSQTINRGYDTFDAAVVAAKSKKEAQGIHPSPLGDWEDRIGVVWAYSPDQVEVELIGKAAPGIEAGVILASFNAG